MRVLSIDPGMTGALAILDGQDVTLLDDLPVHMITTGRKTTRPELDLHTLHEMLARHAPYGHAWVEKVAARPGQGVTSMFRFGCAYGSIMGILAAMAVPYSLIGPKDWQRWAGCGPAPDAARQRACMLFPGSADKLARKRDCHRADALLMAAYGAQTNSAL